MTADYIDLATLKRNLGIGTADTADDADLTRNITTVSRLIDKYCGFPRRQFFAGSANEVRYFTADEYRAFWVDDITTVASIQADVDGDGVYEYTWTLGTDYHLSPYNAAGQSRPYTRVELRTFGVTIMPVVRKGLKITGTWGWPAVPSEVIDACLLQCIRLHKRVVAPFGIAPVPNIDGSGIRLLSKLDSDVELLLRALRRNPIAVG